MKHVKVYVALAAIAGAMLMPAASPATAGHDDGGAAVIDRPLRVLARSVNLKIGTAVNMDALAADAIYRGLVAQQFSSVTAENVMKWGPLEPTRGTIDFGPADTLVNFARANGQVVRGHTLIWHNQLPSWLTSGTFTPEEFRAIVRQHIFDVATHFKGRVYQWDVLNEAFNDDGTLRDTIFLRMMGSGYIADVFRWAHQADRNASLFYNDYNIEGINAKSTAAYNLVKRLRSEGVPIHGIGIQGHLGTQYGFPGDVPENMARFAALGMDVAVTEADVRSILPMDNPKTQAHARGFSVLMQGCLLVRRCTSFTVWGFSDKYQWVPGVFNGEGSAAIYDENFVPKVSYRALQQDMVLANRRR